ncbi:hypothetical protein K402DRAFT_75222 [Aulographum hederae CBS 113979]|uniref:BZIP domain-containing protein n=1 Tax=Aulographum hederae CBS 113979 TaxID=1176131 RepID=A0A6G1HG95_9PEZI|nr:hypothetical protein K402DRAFT_75222 [Aulographum hederae CBS 113979]
MPRKASTIAPDVRIRENQRRARARRKDLIDGLQSRVRDSKNQGAVATAHMQKAARKVLLENGRLRVLLETKGVPAAEIEAFLERCDSNDPLTVTLSTLETVGLVSAQNQSTRAADLQKPADMHNSSASKQMAPATSLPHVLMEGGFEGANPAGKSGHSTGSSCGTELWQPGKRSEEDAEHRSPIPDLLGPVSDCFCPEIDPAPTQIQSCETDCSIAATILAGFRGHGDLEDARAELGCPDTAQCSIKNAALLHAMDSEHERVSRNTRHMSR